VEIRSSDLLPARRRYSIKKREIWEEKKLIKNDIYLPFSNLAVGNEKFKKGNYQ